jgi:ribonucleoside-diphosphate reductase beta chain
MKQQQAHWLWTEVPMMADVNDWKQNLNETEKNIIGSILKGFAQTETVVNDYWTQLVTKWFRKPEVIAMAVTFGCFETIHAEAYSLLNEESFKLQNKLKGVGQIVEWSIRDESLHSDAGCWLFRTLLKEHPEYDTPELKADIEEAAKLSLKLELDFIDKVYEMGDLEGCTKYDLTSFIKHRVNTKMGDLGYGPIVNGIDQEAVQRMSWFDNLSGGKQHTDFFANRVTNYSKGVQDWDANSIF